MSEEPKMPTNTVQAGWYLDFYDFTRTWAGVDDLVPGCGDILERARRNGAKHGTPFLLDPASRADARVNAYWRAPGVRGLAEGTQRRYAFSLKVWLDFCDAIGVAWDRAGRGEFAAFKEWRMAAADNPHPVSANAFYADRAAIRRFYDWAEAEHGITNPVGVRVVGETFFGDPVLAPEGTPSGIRRADVKWLTPGAFRQWRDIGLSGFGADGLQLDRWRGDTEDRDVAFAETLFGTGLRAGEAASLLTIELPPVGEQRLFRARLAGACAKRGIGRPFWIRRRVAQLVRSYLDDGTRADAVARAQAAGRYDHIGDKWILLKVHGHGAIMVADGDGLVREVRLEAMPPRLRMRLFRDTDRGLEPVWLWLNHNGLPRPKAAWSKTFDRANARVAKALDQHDSPGQLFARPHMLRHSFALRWYCIATFLAWQRTNLLTKAEQRDFRNQLGDVWFLLATLLGHRSAETTRNVYLEPFQALEVEHLVAVMDADDRAALERLMDVLAAGEPRLLTGATS